MRRARIRARSTGHRVAVVAPCGVHDPARLERGLELARGFGVDVVPFPDLLRPVRYLAASDEHRAEQLIEALTDPRWSAVWIARGGYGMTRLLPRMAALPPVHKPVLGFSDVTALFCAMRTWGWTGAIHAPVVHSLAVTDPGSLEHLFALLAGQAVPALRGESWIEGRASGPLIGGNLSLIAALCGTPWQLHARGAILVLEEIGEPAYRVDRLLQQLVSAGVFDDVAGVAVGELVDCRAPEGATYTLRDVLLDHLAPLGVPVVGGLPIGHGAANRAFPWGVAATLGNGALAWDEDDPDA